MFSLDNEMLKVIISPQVIPLDLEISVSSEFSFQRRSTAAELQGMCQNRTTKGHPKVGGTFQEWAFECDRMGQGRFQDRWLRAVENTFQNQIWNRVSSQKKRQPKIIHCDNNQARWFNWEVGTAKKKKYENFCRELSILKTFRHPFLEPVYTWFMVRICWRCWWIHFQNEKKTKVHVIGKYASGGDLFYYLSRSRHFSLEVLLNETYSLSHILWQQATFFAAQIACALEYLDSVNHIWAGLIPDHIWLDADGYIMMKLKDGSFKQYESTFDYLFYLWWDTWILRSNIKVNKLIPPKRRKIYDVNKQAKHIIGGLLAAFYTRCYVAWYIRKS